MLVPELAEKILRTFRHAELKNFALACTATFGIVSSTVDQRDSCSGLMPAAAPDTLVQELLDKGKWTARELARRKLGKMLLICQFRRSLVQDGKWRADFPYEQQFWGLTDIIVSLQAGGSGIQHLQLHRVQLLDTRIVSMLLLSDCMPNLRYFSIMQCELMHFANTMELLEIMEKRNKGDHPIEKFDFFPRLHQGPNDTFRMGSFGVTWQDAGVSTAQGVLSTCLWRIFPKAEELGFDFTSLTASFRLWLEQTPIPLWSVPRAISLFHYMHERGLAMADKGRGSSLDHWHNQLFGVLHGAASVGMEKSHKMFKMHRCVHCDIEYPYYLIWSGNRNLAVCKGCCLQMVLEDERDHYLPGKRFIVTRYLWVPREGDKSDPFNADDSRFITDLKDLVVEGYIDPQAKFYLPGEERPVVDGGEVAAPGDPAQETKRASVTRQRNLAADQARWLFDQRRHNRQTPWNGPRFPADPRYFVHPTQNPIEDPGVDKERDEDQCVHLHDWQNPVAPPPMTGAVAVPSPGGGMPQLQWHNPRIYEPAESWDGMLARDRAARVAPEWRRMVREDRRRVVEYFLATLPMEARDDGVWSSTVSIDVHNLETPTIQRLYQGKEDHDFKWDPDGVWDTVQINWERAVNWDGDYAEEEAWNGSWKGPEPERPFNPPTDPYGGMPRGFW